MTSARSGLMPGILRRSRGVRSASSSTRAVERVARDREALDAEARQLLGQHHRGREVADGAADPDQPPLGRAEPVGRAQLVADVLAQRLELLRLDAVVRQEPLGRHDRAEPPRARVERAPLPDVRELHRAAADVERDAVGQRRRVHRGEVAEPRLLLAREHLDREPGARAGLAHELLAVARLADRRRGERPDPLDPRRAAEVREQLDRLQRALHRLGLERPVRLLVLADAHRLVDLVRPLPPLVGVGEDDEPERVRAEVDDGEAALHGHHPTDRRGEIPVAAP